jgi:dsRNA-specific ribonuclease
MEHISLQLLATELNASLMVSSIDTRYLFSALIGRSSLMDTDYERLEFFGKIQTIRSPSSSITLD